MRGHVVVRSDSKFIDWGRENGFDVLVDPMPWPDRYRPWVILWHAARVAAWARQAKIDVIHCNEHNVYPFARVLRKFLRRPVVCHARYRVDRSFATWTFLGKRGPDVLLWTSYQQKADSADAMQGILPEGRQHVLRLGVDLEVFGKQAHTRDETRAAWGILPDDIVIGTASPLRPRKRIEDFIQLTERMSIHHPGVVGLIAGDAVPGEEDYRHRVEEMIAGSRLGRRLQWIGHLEPVEAFYHACDIVVSTSEYETFGNSVCEAMACGKPVVAYRGGSVAEVVGNTGLIVETGRLDDLCLAVERLMQNVALRDSLGENARQRVASEFDPSLSLRQLTTIYRSLLEASH